MSDGVSVVVCCYNSELRLPKTLEALSKQEVTSPFGWEVIVVDNNSTDNTGKVAEELWMKLESPVSMRIIKEPTPGLSNARMSGAKASKFEYLIFCDDDNWLFPNYVETVWRFLEHNKQVGVVGGVGIPVCDGKLPPWFTDYQSHYAVGYKSQMNNCHTVYGAGMALRRKKFIKLYKENIPCTEDRKGSNLISGGDDEICYRFRLAGLKVVCLQELQFYHFIPSQRLSLDYLRRLSYAMGSSRIHLMGYFYALNPLKLKTRNQFLLWAYDFIYLLKARIMTKDKYHKKNLNGSLAEMIKLRFNYSKKILRIVNFK
jgi:glycosyltransferase involved in cell wall biosynthesis